MSDVAAPDAQPVMMTDAYVELGGANLQCLCMEVSLTADPNPMPVATFGAIVDYPGAVKWHFVAKFLQSFNAGATDDTLTAALAAFISAGTPCAFKVRPYGSRPASPSNPQFEGELIPQDYTVFGGTAGAQSEVDIDWTMTGPPTRTTSLVA